MPVPVVVKLINKRLYCLQANKGIRRKVADWFIGLKAKKIYKRISPYLKTKSRDRLMILDVGSGSGGVSCELLRNGFKNLFCLDVVDLLAYKNLKVILYDGEKIPFTDKKFDVAIIIHVLHHCGDSSKTLKEALRVAKRVVFIEDTYRTKLERIIVSVNDALGNFEFYAHPYKTPKQWRQLLAGFKAKVKVEENWSEFSYGFLYGRYVMFVVEGK